MQTAFNSSTDNRRPEAYWAAVADLVSLIQRTRTLEPPPSPADGAGDIDDVVVLDDVTPAAALAIAAIGNCNLRLREALHFLLEARSAEKQRLRAS